MMENFKNFFKEILDYLDMNEKEFNEIIDKFRQNIFGEKTDQNRSLNKRFGNNKCEKSELSQD